MKQFRHFLVLVAALVMAAASCQQAPFLTMTGPRTFNFTRDGGSQSFTFSCNRDWSVSSTESWVTVSPSSGTAADGEITVKITCAANNTYDGRSATVTVRTEELSETVTVTQDTGIGLIVSPTTFDLTNAAQDIEIEVQKNVQYSIAIDEAGLSWIKAGGTKALTTDKITFHIAENVDYDGREGKITFKQTDGPLTATVVVRQSQKNGLFITTSTYDLSNEAHTLAVEVKANVEFEVTSQTDWIKYVETKGLKASTVTLAIDANESYDNRTGSVLVKQTNGNLEGTIIINQKQTDGLFVTPDSFEVSNQEQTVELTVKENVAYSVVIPDAAKTWVAVQGSNNTKALVEEKVVLAIAKNTTYDDRETSVTIKQNDGPLTETVRIKQAYGEGLIVETKTYEIDRESGSVEVDVMANVEYEVETDATWVHYVQTKALSKSTVELSVDENKGYTTREATVNIKQKNGTLVQTVTISQTPFGHIVFEDYNYKTIKYGEREWFAENLRAKYGFEQGENVNSDGYGTWPYAGSGWAERDGELIYSLERLLYQDGMEGKTICPEGWHVSTSEDWKQLLTLSQSTNEIPYIKTTLGGTDDYSFGGIYGEWHNSSFWINKDFLQLFQEWTEIKKDEGIVVKNNSTQYGPYPSSKYRLLRCVKGPIEPSIMALPVIKQTTTTAQLRAEVVNDKNSTLVRGMKMVNNDYNKVTKAWFKYGLSKEDLSSVAYPAGGTLNVNVTGLTPGTVYYYQAFAEYEGGSSPVTSEVLSFKTYYGTLEYQGDVYYTTIIGNVEFMSQNLRATALNDGTPIPLKSATDDWLTTTELAQCIAYNEESRLEPYGRMYNGYALKTEKVCPAGWRLPKYSEVINENNGDVLASGNSMLTGSLFLADNTYWGNPVFCSNDLALSLLPSGYRYWSNGWSTDFCQEGFTVYLWAINDEDSNKLNALRGFLQLGYRGEIFKYEYGPILSDQAIDRTGCAVRCVRDVK